MEGKYIGQLPGRINSRGFQEMVTAPFSQTLSSFTIWPQARKGDRIRRVPGHKTKISAILFQPYSVRSTSESATEREWGDHVIAESESSV